MSELTGKILTEALALPPIDRVELIEQLLASFEFPKRKSVDKLWASEVEDRINAYDKGELSTVKAREVFEKIGKL